MYLFLDTETTGLPLDWKAPVGQLDNWPRIVEIGWILSDKDGQEIESQTLILKPDGFLIPKESSDIHGITNEQANSQGADRIAVLKQFATLLDKAQVLVAHNIEFDKKVLHAELIRYNIKSNIHKIDKLCTKELTTDYCKIPGNYGYKWPTLSELYEKVFSIELSSSHSASSDVKACKDCFFELVNRSVIKLYGSKVLVDTIADTDDDDLIEVDPIEEEINYNGDFQYFTRVRHHGLKEHKFLKAHDEWVLDEKIEKQTERFQAKWEKAKNKLQGDYYKQSNLLEAQQRTIEAEEQLKQVETLLEQTVLVNDAVNWEDLKNKRPYKEQTPEKDLQNLLNAAIKPAQPVYLEILREPKITDADFQPKFNLIENYILKSLKRKKQDKYNQLFQQAYDRWKAGKESIEHSNKQKKEKHLSELDIYNKELEAIKSKNKEDVIEWENRKQKYYQEQKEFNLKIDQLKENYFAKDPHSIIENCDLVLSNSKYPEFFPKTFELQFIKEEDTLILDFCLPVIDTFPRVKHVKFIKASQDFKETQISQTQLNTIYNNAIFQISIRTVHELFEADVINCIKKIYFNGFVDTSSKRYIISYQADKDTFNKLQLKNLDSKDAIKQFNGIFTAKWTEINPLRIIESKTKSTTT